MSGRTLALLLPTALFFAALIAAAVWAQVRRRASAPSAADAAGGFADEYFLGSRSLKGVVLAMSLIATYGSVSSFVSGPGVAWSLGLGWVVFAAPQIIAGFLILGLLGKKLALVSRAVGAITVVDVLRARYGSAVLALLSAVSLLVFFTAMMMGQFIGGAAIFSEAAGISPEAGLALFGGLVVIYTAWGGFRAVAWTDAVCAVLMLAGMAMLGEEILSSTGGLEAAITRAAEAAGPASGFLSPTAGGALPLTLLFSAWLLVGFGTAGLPQSAVRCMSYRSTKDLHLAMIVSTVICGALMIGLTTLGALARGIPDLTLAGQSSDHLIPKLIAEHMPPWAAGITLIGPLAATMSTVSSLLIAAASAVVKDLALHYRPSLAQNEKGLARLSVFSTVALGCIAAAAALQPPSLIAWINMAAFGGLELVFLLPLGLGLFWRRANAAGAIASIAAGLTVYGWCLIGRPEIGGLHASVPAMAAALAVFAIVPFFTRAESAPLARCFFAAPSKRP